MNENFYRVLTKDDAEQFKELRRAVVTVSPVGMGTTLDEELQRPSEFFHDQLSLASPSRMFAAFSGSRLVATAGIRWWTKYPSGKHGSILHHVQTAPEFRRQSLARRLVKQAIDYAFSQDCLRIYLYTYIPNAEAVSLYESLGFVACGGEPEALHIDGNYYDLTYMSLRNPSRAPMKPKDV